MLALFIIVLLLLCYVPCFWAAFWWLRFCFFILLFWVRNSG